MREMWTALTPSMMSSHSPWPFCRSLILAMSLIMRTLSPTLNLFTLTNACGWNVQRLLQLSNFTLMSPLSVTRWTIPTLPMYWIIRGFQPPWPSCRIFNVSSGTLTLTFSPVLKMVMLSGIREVELKFWPAKKRNWDYLIRWKGEGEGMAYLE